MSTSSTTANASHEHTIKETIISLLISFVMALVFRSYVVEAFVIPTGSMAPTLLGKHTLHRSDITGNEWAQNPTFSINKVPLPVQGGKYNRPLISATDPMTTSRFNNPANLDARRNGISTPAGSKRLLTGDRILVQKYLFEIFPPARYDVVVFKNPDKPAENYIKRLIGLPNEQVLIAEGDIFSRPLDADGEPTGSGEYEIQRKPRRIMDSLWRTIFSIEFNPRVTADGFSNPWIGDGWEAHNGTMVHEGAGPARLEWDSASWPVWDWEPYNEPYLAGSRNGPDNFPVGDVRVRAGVEPASDGTDISMSIIARGHEFEVLVVGSAVTLRMRRAGPGDTPGQWANLASETISPLRAGRVTNIEFWHYDQRLELHKNGKLVAAGDYDWNASDRLLNTVGSSREHYEQGASRLANIGLPRSYDRAKPSISMSFSGGPVVLHRAGLDRDIYHRPTVGGGRAGHATHPNTAIKLGPDHFFTLGDNSPASSDGRMWTKVDPRVAELVDGTLGVVHRDLMLGKAFFVYFPAVYKIFDRFPIPNAGDMRLIR